MPLTEAAKKELERLGAENVARRLNYAGAGSGSVVPGIVAPDPLRRDVEDWVNDRLAERDRREAKDKADILWWAKAATWVGAGGIVVAIIIAALGH
jgi:hypothetical protein